MKHWKELINTEEAINRLRTDIDRMPDKDEFIKHKNNLSESLNVLLETIGLNPKENLLDFRDASVLKDISAKNNISIAAIIGELIDTSLSELISKHNWDTDYDMSDEREL